METKQLNKLLEEYVDGYFVYRMVYFVAEDIDADVYEFLDRINGVALTDYDIKEFSKDSYDNIIAEFDNYTEDQKRKADGTLLTVEEFKAGLGSISKLFDEDKLDLAIEVY